MSVYLEQTATSVHESTRVSLRASSIVQVGAGGCRGVQGGDSERDCKRCGCQGQLGCAGRFVLDVEITCCPPHPPPPPRHPRLSCPHMQDSGQDSRKQPTYGSSNAQIGEEEQDPGPASVLAGTCKVVDGTLVCAAGRAGAVAGAGHLARDV